MQNTALVIIDVQNDITKNYKSVIENINAAISWACAQAMPVVYIKHNNIAAGRTFKPGTYGAEIVAEMNIVSNYIFTKNRGSALTCEAFCRFIKDYDIREFFIAGADAVSCVRLTCFNMRKEGYIVHVLSDCIFSHDMRRVDDMLVCYADKGCIVERLCEAMDSVADRAATENMHSIIIRQEQPSDYGEVYDMVKCSFAHTDYSDGTEADYLSSLRNKSCFIPELSLVAVEGSMIVGQIVLYRMQLNCTDKPVEQLVISPLSVRFDHFRHGIGTMLIEHGCRLAKKSGYKAVFLCGSYAYYSRFGFVPSCQYGIYHCKDKTKDADWCLVKELEEGFLSTVSGSVAIE